MIYDSGLWIKNSDSRIEDLMILRIDDCVMIEVQGFRIGIKDLRLRTEDQRLRN